MASVQQAQNAKAKANVDKAIEEAKKLLANAKAPSKDQELVKVAGVVHNKQEKTLRIKKKYNDQGDYLGNPAESIPTNGSGAFVHQGATSQGKLPVVVGSKAAIIYSQEGVIGGLSWLLAWYKPAVGTVGNKVHVEAGTGHRLDTLQWSEIEKKLDESSEISRYWDDVTGAEASARIENYGPDMALVGANFEINKEIPPQAN